MKDLKEKIIARMREMLDCPTESLKEMRVEQLKLGRDAELFIVKTPELMNYICSYQVAVLFWLLKEMGEEIE